MVQKSVVFFPLSNKSKSSNKDKPKKKKAKLAYSTYLLHTRTQNYL